MKSRAAALTIPTPDGSGQTVHPDVIYRPGGFLGHKYWMACTPYPFGDDRAENPLIRVSDDGVEWCPFPGAPDPLIEAPPDERWHHADTDLVLHGGRLHLFYVSTNRQAAETTFSLVTTADGVSWSTPVVIYRDQWGVSPAVVAGEDGQWRMWYVWRDALARAQTSQLYRRTATRPTHFGAAERCVLELPGHVVWHLDVIAVANGYEALVAAFPAGSEPSRCRLFHVRSKDGIEFMPTSPDPLLQPSWLGWDNRMVYRSSFLKRADGGYRLWYSAASWGQRCGIGLLEGELTDLRPSKPGRPNWSRLLLEDMPGFGKYLMFRLLPPPLYARVLSARNRLRSALAGQP